MRIISDVFLVISVFMCVGYCSVVECSGVEWNLHQSQEER